MSGNRVSARGIRGVRDASGSTVGRGRGSTSGSTASLPGRVRPGPGCGVGDLVVGDTALAVAVSADHRAEAFAAASALVEQVKARLPVWKHQLFADGTAEWSNMA